MIITTIQLDSKGLVEDPQERRALFLLEFEHPFKCEKCGERFRRKRYLQQHKVDVHSYSACDGSFCPCCGMALRVSPTARMDKEKLRQPLQRFM
jgi:hypothetical protein